MGSVPLKYSPAAASHAFGKLSRVEIDGPSSFHDLFFHAKDDGNRDIRLRSLNVFGAYILALCVLERVEAENDWNARAFIDDIIKVAELRIPHLCSGIIGSGDAITAGIGPHSHDTKIAIAIGQYRGF